MKVAFLLGLQLCLQYVSADTAATADTAASQPKVKVDATTYKNIIKYGDFTYAAQLQPCKAPPLGATLLWNISVAITDTQAALYRLNSTKELILAFPGTASYADILTDIYVLPVPFLTVTNCAGCLVHGGFANAFGSIRQLLDDVLTATLPTHPDYTVTIVGYSLGAALAKLAFVWARDNPNFSARIGPSYSYGEPRVGNEAFAKFTDRLSGATSTDIGLFYRVTHENDGVPQIPARWAGYMHSSTEFWEQNSTSTGKPTSKTVYRCFGREPTDCINAPENQSPEGPNAAHLSYANFNKADVCAACQVKTKLCN